VSLHLDASVLVTLFVIDPAIPTSPRPSPPLRGREGGIAMIGKGMVANRQKAGHEFVVHDPSRAAAGPFPANDAVCLPPGPGFTSDESVRSRRARSPSAGNSRPRRIGGSAPHRGPGRDPAVRTANRPPSP
jgi:hypothetical protein